jgi:hypothetical protein
MNPDFRKTYAEAVAQIGTDLTGLLGSDVTLDRTNTETGLDCLGEYEPMIYRCSSQRLNDASSPAGFLLGEGMSARLGAMLLMMPADSGMTEEVSAAFDEVVNILTGSWKTAASADDRLSNDVSVRKIEPVDRGDLVEDLRSKGLSVVSCVLSVDGSSAPFGFYGAEDWLCVAPKEEEQTATTPTSPNEEAQAGWEGTALKSEGPPTSTTGAALVDARRDETPGPASAAPGSPTERTAAESSGGHASRDTGLPDGVMMVVDLSGELNKWLLAQMEAGMLKFVKPGSRREELTERSPVIMFGPNPDVFRALAVEKCVVIQRPDEPDP